MNFLEKLIEKRAAEIAAQRIKEKEKQDAFNKAVQNEMDYIKRRLAQRLFDKGYFN